MIPLHPKPDTADTVHGADVAAPMRRPVLRFAPSPNGYLHMGHAYSALLNQRLAQQFHGTFLLRIEDIDTGRCRPEFEAAIREDLAWLGIEFDQAPRRQSQHLDTYRAAIADLTNAGLTYPCFCSRADIATAAAENALGCACRDPDGAVIYAGACHRLDHAQVVALQQQGRPYALRLNMAAAMRAVDATLRWRTFDAAMESTIANASPGVWGDVIVARKETPTSYHVSVVVDDALQGVTHIVRGKDLEAATSVHRLLQALWGFTPPDYFHHELVRDNAGEKLAKSIGSKPLRQLRADGVTPQQVRSMLGFDV